MLYFCKVLLRTLNWHLIFKLVHYWRDSVRSCQDVKNVITSLAIEVLTSFDSRGELPDLKRLLGSKSHNDLQTIPLFR